MLKRLLYAARTSHSHSVLFSSARSMSSFNCNFSVVSSMLVLVTSSAAFWDACLAVTYAASFQNRPHSDSSSVFRGYVPKLTPAVASLVASSVLVLSVVSHVLTSSVVFLTWICPLSLQSEPSERLPICASNIFTCSETASQRSSASFSHSSCFFPCWSMMVTSSFTSSFTVFRDDRVDLLDKCRCIVVSLQLCHDSIQSAFPVRRGSSSYDS